MLYGYSNKTLNEYGLLDMREVTIAADSNVLREIARFLNEMAEAMDEGELARCSHRHIDSVVEDWRDRFPGRDIIVMPPAE